MAEIYSRVCIKGWISSNAQPTSFPNSILTLLARSTNTRPPNARYPSFLHHTILQYGNIVLRLETKNITFDKSRHQAIRTERYRRERRATSRRISSSSSTSMDRRWIMGIWLRRCGLARGRVIPLGCVKNLSLRAWVKEWIRTAAKLARAILNNWLYVLRRFTWMSWWCGIFCYVSSASTLRTGPVQLRSHTQISRYLNGKRIR